MRRSGRSVSRTISSASLVANAPERYSSMYFMVVGLLQQGWMVQQLMHQVPHDVIEGDVRFLNAMDARRRHHQQVINAPLCGLPGHCPAIMARIAERDEPHLLPNRKSVQEILGVPTGGDP